MSISPGYTSADLKSLPEIDGVRYEIIDGDLYVSKQPHWHHQRAATRVALALQDWSEQSGAGEAVVAPGLVFAADNDVAPDVVWISGARLAQLMDDSGHLRAAPELVIEVLAPGSVNTHRDRELKLKLYSRQGVDEYWIIDWRLRTVQIYRREHAALQLVCTLKDSDLLTSPLLPGFSYPISHLW